METTKNEEVEGARTESDSTLQIAVHPFISFLEAIDNPKHHGIHDRHPKYLDVYESRLTYR